MTFFKHQNIKLKQNFTSCLLPLLNSLFPVPSKPKYYIPDYLLPIPNSRFPIPDSLIN
ncbi:hypothetical protein [Moorena sp. SIO3H5]|uniref:hypothetical protein n=1 Tax=Moorena sp. SIO3H5 TaxID=2607834 RepID=UPI0013BD2D02|nr:hypothetical protein [Moorena sp. SIO3H5]NEO68663.1 hypothetical protein [Moorena sp. SIO3H5]